MKVNIKVIEEIIEQHETAACFTTEQIAQEILDYIGSVELNNKSKSDE